MSNKNNKSNKKNLPAKRRGRIAAFFLTIGIGIASAFGIHSATNTQKSATETNYKGWEEIPEGQKAKSNENSKSGYGKQQQEQSKMEKSTQIEEEGKEQSKELDGDQFVDDLLDYFKEETGQELSKDDIGFISTNPQYSYYDWTDETHKTNDASILNNRENLIKYAQNGWVSLQESYNGNHSGSVKQSVQGYGIVYKPSKKIIASIGKMGDDIVPYTIDQHFTADRTEYDKSAYIIDLYNLGDKDANWTYTPEECCQIIEDEVNQKEQSKSKKVGSNTKTENSFRENVKVSINNQNVDSKQVQANLSNQTKAPKEQANTDRVKNTNDDERDI